ncbi:hypothetical protein HMPREF3036_00577 [Sutterella sp. KLE1602]|nr:hypothetical protein HMPREF3036_00577 [Sutterella sp. KLE1602]
MQEFAGRESGAFFPEVKNGFDHGAIVPATFLQRKQHGEFLRPFIHDG